MIKIITLLQTTRPAFLILTPVCVFLGLSTSLATVPSINLYLFFFILAGAISAHISVNTLNEYYDFKSGLDLKTNKTPFSGGSGSLPGNPEMAGSVLILGLLSLLLTMVIGIYFVLTRGMQILPPGLAGLILVMTYTQWLNRSPLLCLLAPGSGFGILMVVGTTVILTGEYSSIAWKVSLVPFFLVNNLLLLNQYPDIKADASVGRKTFPIVYGMRKSNVVYTVFMLTSYSLILFYIVKGDIPFTGSIALIPMLFSFYALIGAMKHTSEIGHFPCYMKANVAAAILTPLFLGIAIIIG